MIAATLLVGQPLVCTMGQKFGRLLEGLCTDPALAGFLGGQLAFVRACMVWSCLFQVTSGTACTFAGFLLAPIQPVVQLV